MKKLLIVSVLVAGAVVARADDSSIFQAALTPDIAIHDKTTRINGLSLSIWGENPQSGVAIGFVNGSTGESKGFSWGIVNYDESYSGLQLGFLNTSSKSFVGWQNGFINWDQGSFRGLEDGMINISEDTRGVQLGAFNYAENLKGIQLGFINIANNNSWFKDFPDQLAKGFVFVNWSF
jgi:hypothetical protein